MTALIKNRGESTKTSFSFNNDPGKLEKLTTGLVACQLDMGIGII